MGISRKRAVERAKRKQLKETMKWIMLPVTIADALLPKKKKRKRKKKLW